MKGKCGGEWSCRGHRETSESTGARGGQTSLVLSTWGGRGGGQQGRGILLSMCDAVMSCLSSVLTSSGPALLLCGASSRLWSLESREHLWPLRNFALLFLNHTWMRKQVHLSKQHPLLYKHLNFKKGWEPILNGWIKNLNLWRILEEILMSNFKYRHKKQNFRRHNASLQQPSPT